MDLRSLRTLHLATTQQRLADQLEVSVERLRRWEYCPHDIPASIIIRLMQVTALPFNRLVSHGYPAPLTPGWRCPPPRPVVAFCGPPDSGKTTLINYLTGSVLKADWTPTTAIPVLLKHKATKPRWLRQDCFVVRKANRGEEEWDHRLHKDRGYMRKWILRTCNLSQLRRLSARTPSSSTPEQELGPAVFYMNSALLRVCDVLDLPGINSGGRPEDDDWARWGARRANLLVYVSPACAFMRGDDLTFLAGTMSGTQHHLVVASQAHVVDGGDEQALKHILSQAQRRLQDEVRQQRQAHPIDVQRFATYSAGWADLRQDFERKLLDSLKTLNEAAPSV